MPETLRMKHRFSRGFFRGCPKGYAIALTLKLWEVLKLKFPGIGGFSK
jgi:hypothetical protein